MKSKFRSHLRQAFVTRAETNPRLSLRSFARSLNLAPSTLHQYLSGKYPPTERNLEMIATQLNWSPELIIEIRHELEHVEVADAVDECAVAELENPVLISSLKINRRHLPKIAKELSRFSEQLNKTFGKGTTECQLIAGFISKQARRKR